MLAKTAASTASLLTAKTAGIAAAAGYAAATAAAAVSFFSLSLFVFFFLSLALSPSPSLTHAHTVSLSLCLHICIIYIYIYVYTHDDPAPPILLPLLLVLLLPTVDGLLPTSLPASFSPLPTTYCFLLISYVLRTISTTQGCLPTVYFLCYLPFSAYCVPLATSTTTATTTTAPNFQVLPVI